MVHGLWYSPRQRHRFLSQAKFVKLQCKVISEVDSIVENLLVQDKPVLAYLASGRNVSQDESPLACKYLVSMRILRTAAGQSRCRTYVT